jgi:hypothetical protein
MAIACCACLLRCQHSAGLVSAQKKPSGRIATVSKRFIAQVEAVFYGELDCFTISWGGEDHEL